MTDILMPIDDILKRLREKTGELNAVIVDAYSHGLKSEVKRIVNNTGLYGKQEFVQVNLTASSDEGRPITESLTPFSDMIGADNE